MYFFHLLDPCCPFFSWGCDLELSNALSTLKRSLESGTPVVVRDLGRDLEEPCNNGVVGEELVGDGFLDDTLDDGGTVW